jgi:hypothetical protein
MPRRFMSIEQANGLSCDCPWQGEPAHDEDPMRFHLETGFVEDQYFSRRLDLPTMCPRHFVQRTRTVGPPSSARSDDDEELPTLEMRRMADAAPVEPVPEPATLLQRHQTPPLPCGHPAWLRIPETRIHEVSESIGSATYPRSNGTADIRHRTHMPHQRPERVHVRAQRRQRIAELVSNANSRSEMSRWQTLHGLHAITTDERGRQSHPEPSVSRYRDDHGAGTAEASDAASSDQRSDVTDLNVQEVSVRLPGTTAAVGRAREEMTAQLRRRNRRGSRLENRQRVLQMAREGLESSLRELDLEAET